MVRKYAKSRRRNRCSQTPVNLWKHPEESILYKLIVGMLGYCLSRLVYSEIVIPCLGFLKRVLSKFIG